MNTVVTIFLCGVLIAVLVGLFYAVPLMIEGTNSNKHLSDGAKTSFNVLTAIMGLIVLGALGFGINYFMNN